MRNADFGMRNEIRNPKSEIQITRRPVLSMRRDHLALRASAPPALIASPAPGRGRPACVCASSSRPTSGAARAAGSGRCCAASRAPTIVAGPNRVADARCAAAIEPSRCPDSAAASVIDLRDWQRLRAGLLQRQRRRSARRGVSAQTPVTWHPVGGRVLERDGGGEPAGATTTRTAIS